MIQKKVYVAGCFDLFHRGHVNLLEEASKHGCVILGLLTDNAVKSFKRQPINTYEDRLAVLKSIKYIHSIIPQKTLDYYDNLIKLKPHYVVHGNDWKSGVQSDTRKKVIKILNIWNGTLIEPNYTKEISTSEIIEKITILNK